MFNVDETMRSLSVPMSVGHVTSLTDLREKRKAAEHAAMSAYSSMRAAKEHAARPVQYIEQPTPFYELERQPFSPSRTRSAEELHHLQRSTRELNTFTRICSTPPRDERALNARYAFQLAPEDQRYLHRKLSNGPTRAQRGYPPELDEAMLSAGWRIEMPSAPCDDRALSARMVPSRAQAAPTQPRAPPEPLGSLWRLQESRLRPPQTRGSSTLALPSSNDSESRSRTHRTLTPPGTARPSRGIRTTRRWWRRRCRRTRWTRTSRRAAGRKRPLPCLRTAPQPPRWDALPEDGAPAASMGCPA